MQFLNDSHFVVLYPHIDGIVFTGDPLPTILLIRVSLELHMQTPRKEIFTQSQVSTPPQHTKHVMERVPPPYMVDLFI